MAGIFGFLSNNSEYKADKFLDILKKHALFDFKYSSNECIINNGAAGIGFASPYLDSTWPIKSKNKQFLFQLFGEIYLPNGTLITSKNFELFLELFLNEKYSILPKLNGAFVFALYDILNKKLYICNDPFGNYALYYYSSSKIFLFSSQIHGIYESIQNKTWDEKGFYEYLGLGYSLNGKTYYNNIKKLQAGEALYYDRSNIVIKKYLDFKYEAEKLNIRKNIDTIKHSLIRSIEIRFRNHKKIGAALTGGFDSRVTWGIINKLNFKDKAIAFTHGLKDARDIQISKKITSELNINHKIKVFDELFINQLHEQWLLFVKVTEGLINVIGAHAIQSWKFLQNEIDILLDSHGGALFRRQFMKVAEYRIKTDKSFEEQFFDHVKSPLLNLNILKEEFKQPAMQYSVKGLGDYFSKLNRNMTYGDKIDKFYLEQISGNRYSLAANAQMNWMRLAHPFLNTESFQALATIPVSKRYNQSIYKYIISQTTPQLKNFSLENMGMPAPYFGFVYFRYIPMVYELILRKTIPKISYSLYKSLTLKKFVSDYNLFFKLNFKELKETLLRENKSYFEIIKKDALENLICWALKTSNLSILSMPLTLKLFYDVYHQDK